MICNAFLSGAVYSGAMRVMNIPIVMVMLLATFLTANAQQQPPPDLRLVTEEYPPMNFTNESGHVTGYATVLVQESARRAGLTTSIRMLPWKRAYYLAQNEEATCVFSMWRTPEREKLFKWVGPLAMDAWSFYARRADQISLKDIADSFNYSVGVVDGWGFTQHLKDVGHPNLDPVAEDVVNLKKLNLGRIQLWATGRVTAWQLFRDEGGADIEEVFAIREIPLSLGCHLSTPDEVINRLQTMLDSLEADGTAASLLENF